MMTVVTFACILTAMALAVLAFTKDSDVYPCTDPALYMTDML